VPPASLRVKVVSTTDRVGVTASRHIYQFHSKGVRVRATVCFRRQLFSQK